MKYLLSLALAAVALAAPVDNEKRQLFGSGSSLFSGLGSGSSLLGGLSGGSGLGGLSGGSGLGGLSGGLGGLGGSSGGSLFGGLGGSSGGGLFGGSSSGLLGGLGGGSSGGLLGGLGGGSGGLLGGLGSGGGSDTSNDFVQGGCKGTIMIYARASTESGNIGSSLGPLLKTQLNAKLNGDFALQGVEYPASLSDNFLPGGSSPSAISTMQGLLEKAASQCPEANLVAGGYSQGTAVSARSIEKLNANVRERIKAVVLFGYTQNQQLRGGIPGMPADRVKVFCNQGDEVCTGTLNIKTPHFQYSNSVPAAVDFIVQRVQ